MPQFYTNILYLYNYWLNFPMGFFTYKHENVKGTNGLLEFHWRKTRLNVRLRRFSEVFQSLMKRQIIITVLKVFRIKLKWTYSHLGLFVMFSTFQDEMQYIFLEKLYLHGLLAVNWCRIIRAMQMSQTFLFFQPIGEKWLQSRQFRQIWNWVKKSLKMIYFYRDNFFI